MPGLRSHEGDSQSNSSTPEAIRVFISYSHDSPVHEQRVLRLAQRLRDGGITCELDQYEEAPPEGWPRWMANQLRLARYVLVVCTANYLRRVSGTERPGVGLGARWEGTLITQDLYERGGRNDKFIPVVFESKDLAQIPDFLRHTTHYDLSERRQQEKLYGRLTNQPRIVRNPVGKVRQLSGGRGKETGLTRARREENSRFSPTRDSSANSGRGTSSAERGSSSNSKRVPRDLSLALIREATGQSYFIPLISAEARGEETSAVLQPAAGPQRAFLENVANRRFAPPTVDFVFGFSAMRARLKSVTHTFAEGTDRFTLVLVAEAGQQWSAMEMAINGRSPDEIARLRARRILLNEALPDTRSSGSRGFGEEALLESMIRGLHATVSVERSPLPLLFREIGATNKKYFLAAATLTAILWLRLSGTVAHVLELELKFSGANRLKVRFRGARDRVYTNKAPEIILVEGDCQLNPENAAD